MAAPTVRTVDTVPPPATRADAPADYVPKQDKFMAALPPLAVQINGVAADMNALGGYLDQLRTDVNVFKNAATTAADSAGNSASAAATSAGQAQTYAAAAQAAAGAPAISNKADQVLSVNANATGVEWRVTAPRPSASIAGKFVRYNAAGNAFEAADGVKYFESAQQLVSNTTSMNISHGLGVMPKGVSVVIVCLTAEFGYSVGDRLEQNIAYHLGFSGSNRNLGVSIRATSSQIMYKSSGLIMGYSASESIPTVVLLTPANWAVVVRAWA